MDPGEQITGTRDEHYNLISALYHALQGADACDTYALDAEATGGRVELVDFFRETQITYAAVAERAKDLLGIPEVPPPFGVPPDVPSDAVMPSEDVVVVEEEDVLLEDLPLEGIVPPDDVVVVEEEEAVLEDVPSDIPPEDIVPPEEALLATDVAPEDPEAAVRVTPEDLDATILTLRGGVATLAIERALAEIDDWQVRLSESGDPELLPVAENLRRLSALLTTDHTDAQAVGEVLRTLGSQTEHLADSGAAPAEISGKLKTLGGLLASEGDSVSG